jgi:hypothetical protein
MATLDLQAGDRVTEFTSIAAWEAALRTAFPDNLDSIQQLRERLWIGLMSVTDLRELPLRTVLEKIGPELKQTLATVQRSLRFDNEVDFDFPQPTAIVVGRHGVNARTSYVTTLSFADHHGNFPMHFVPSKLIMQLPQPLVDVLPVDVSIPVTTTALSKYSSLTCVYLLVQHGAIHRAHESDFGAVQVHSPL